MLNAEPKYQVCPLGGVPTRVKVTCPQLGELLVGAVGAGGTGKAVTDKAVRVALTHPALLFASI